MRLQTSRLSLVLLLLTVPALVAPRRAATPAAAETRDPHLLELASDGNVQFVDVETRIAGRILSRAPVLIDVDGLDPMVSSALTAELMGSGRVDVVERDALRDQRELRNDSPAAPAPAVRGAAPVPAAPASTRAFGLSAENLLVEAPRDATRWQPPDALVQWRAFDQPHAPSIPALVGAAAPPEGKVTCAELRWIDAVSGTVRWNGLACGADTEDGRAALRARLLREAQERGGGCGGNARVLQLPTQRGDGQLGAVGPAYQELNEALAAAGCQVVDLPPGAEKEGGGDAWSYHRRPFDLVGASRLKGWSTARYAIQVRATPGNRDVEALREALADMDEQLVDPDLVRWSDRRDVPSLQIEVKAVDLTNGRIVSQTRIDTGAAAPAPVIASFIADSVLSRTPSAWVEFRPMPSTAEGRIDRAAVATHEGVGLVRLEGGKHAAELLFAGSSRPEATAAFTLRATDFGVLAMAAPNAALQVTTNCEGATVAGDGIGWGAAPVTKTVSLQEHTISATAEGWGSASKTVTPRVGETNRLTIELPGTLNLTVSPAEATISVTGTSGVGTGSLNLAEVPYGPRDVTWHLDGYGDHTETVAVQSCAVTQASYTFNGTLNVASTPDLAEVRLDGNPQGRVPLAIVTRAGAHEVGCYWCEYGSDVRTVEVEPGRSQDVPLTLNGKGFRYGLGLLAGVVKSGGLAAEAGVTAEAWANGRLGLLSGLAFTTSDALRFNVGPAWRLLAPAPGWAMPLSLRLEVLNQGSTTELGGSLGLDFRACAGRATSWDIGAAIGATAQGGVLASVQGGVLWRGGSPWKSKVNE
jgi:hypothetical protein